MSLFNYRKLFYYSYREKHTLSSKKFNYTDIFLIILFWSGNPQGDTTKFLSDNNFKIKLTYRTSSLYTPYSFKTSLLIFF